jgi:opacity protein-like surface antigen
MKTLNSILLAGAVVMSAGFGAARAADILPVDLPPIYSEAPELTPVEIGNGWYLRGDVGYDFESDTERSRNLHVGAFTDGGQGSELTIEDGANVQIGAGYQFTDFLRADVTGRYSKSDVNGAVPLLGGCLWAEPCEASDSAEMTNWEIMGNAYVDLGTVAGFTPYLGAGAGAVHVDYENASIRYCDALLNGAAAGCEDISAEGRKDWRFAYSLMAGVSYDVSQALKLDLGYRFLDVDGGNAYEVDSAILDDVNVGLTAQDDGFQRHTIQAGLRYSLF